MLVTSKLPIQTTKSFYSVFDLHLCPPTLKKLPPPMTSSDVLLLDSNLARTHSERNAKKLIIAKQFVITSVKTFIFKSRP